MGDVFVLDEPSIALVIGNDQYTCQKPLSGCVDDATRLADRFSQLRFCPDLKTDVDHQAMQLAIDKFVESATSLVHGSDRRVDRTSRRHLLLFFYAGHAIERAGRAILLPVDYRSPERESDTQQNGIDLEDALVRPLNRIRRHCTVTFACMVVMDACREDLSRVTWRALEGQEDSMEQTRLQDARGPALEAKKNEKFASSAEFAFLWACDPGRLAGEDSVEKCGWFSDAFIRCLYEKNLKTHEIFLRISRQVSETTCFRQRPRFDSRLLQDIVLNPTSGQCVTTQDRDEHESFRAGRFEPVSCWSIVAALVCSLSVCLPTRGSPANLASVENKSREDAIQIVDRVWSDSRVLDIPGMLTMNTVSHSLPGQLRDERFERSAWNSLAAYYHFPSIEAAQKYSIGEWGARIDNQMLWQSCVELRLPATARLRQLRGLPGKTPADAYRNAVREGMIQVHMMGHRPTDLLAARVAAKEFHETSWHHVLQKFSAQGIDLQSNQLIPQHHERLPFWLANLGRISTYKDLKKSLEVQRLNMLMERYRASVANVMELNTRGRPPTSNDEQDLVKYQARVLHMQGTRTLFVTGPTTFSTQGAQNWAMTWMMELLLQAHIIEPVSEALALLGTDKSTFLRETSGVIPSWAE